ncbi:MAG: hypothetical protein V7K50_27545 [Nostoc sp.]|uniref:hypothetical protein n=1 Tax=Nostoc sp. TaxID=1180 RepID=UPI002FF6BE96
MFFHQLQTRDDKTGNRGYAVGFEGLVDFVHSAAPQNRFVEEVVREEMKMFPKQALRELIANALVHQDFADMSKSDRIRACYQHCCLLYVSNQPMSNQTLRERFRLSESRTATVSLIIEAGLIKADESESTSTRYARYLPFWA